MIMECLGLGLWHIQSPEIDIASCITTYRYLVSYNYTSHPCTPRISHSRYVDMNCRYTAPNYTRRWQKDISKKHKENSSSVDTRNKLHSSILTTTHPHPVIDAHFTFYTLLTLKGNRTKPLNLPTIN